MTNSKTASSLCCSNPPNLSATSGEGTVVDDFGGIKSYIAGSVDSKRAVILISDVYGFEAPNLRKIADKVAACGYFVVVPDFIHGDPFKLDDSTRPFPVWLQSHTTEKGFEEAKPVVAALKEKGASSVGAAGYCWGAKVVTELAKAAEIQAAVLLHPSLVSVDDIRGIFFFSSGYSLSKEKKSVPLVNQLKLRLFKNNVEMASFKNL
ncbi:alpha/beta-Hydrolases superfamily protein [Rhynchospora pubera]|uniref:Alpha/beta-Hydrolases superfamily protein n=1 Tax=Rhynchospora pubera TaxID=906938 RepID=A0AAV8EFP0_9POAL|nr:alpha/beta-Hydrolases superfamily protein [Rhynchospora pubera]